MMKSISSLCTLLLVLPLGCDDGKGPAADVEDEEGDGVELDVPVEEDPDTADGPPDRLPDPEEDDDAGEEDEAGPATLSGAVTLQEGVFPPLPGDGAGTVYIGAMTEEELESGEPPEAMTVITADFSAGPAEYAIGDLAGGAYYVFALLDDNENFSIAQPMDEGDVVNNDVLPVEIPAGEDTSLDIELNFTVVSGDPRCGDEPLDAAERRCVFEFIWHLADRYHPFFTLKGIDWDAVYDAYDPLVDEPATDREFHFLMFQLLAELRDGHSWDPKLMMRYFPWGIGGIKLALVEDLVYVERVEPGSDAGTAGLQVGDEVLSIDGRTVTDFSGDFGIYVPHPNDHWYASILLPAWTSSEVEMAAAVQVRRGSDVIDLSIPRSAWIDDTPELVTSARLMGASGSEYGYIRISTFDTDMGDICGLFHTALDALIDADGMIVDVRENGGGNLDCVDEVMSRFVDAAVVVERQYLRGSSDRYFTRSLAPGGNAYLGPLAVLMDEGSYSGGNLLPSVLRNIGRATVLGRPSGGGGAGVEEWQLTTEMHVKMGVYLLTLDDGTVLEMGMPPDVAVEKTAGDIQSGLYSEPGVPEHDVVLERALAELGD